MAQNQKQVAKFREEEIKRLTDYYESIGEEVLRIASNAISIPKVDEQGNEYYLKIVVSIPKGSKGEDFDGHLMALDYEQKEEEKRIKAEEQAKKKAKKIEEDKKLRAQKEEQRRKEQEKKGK